MRRRLYRVCQSLVAAGSLTLTLPAAAQMTSAVPAVNAGASSEVGNSKGGTLRELASSTENPNRLTEIQVEMAWLADPATFPYRLTARVQGLTLRVSGCVPSSGVRSHVLQ